MLSTQILRSDLAAGAVEKNPGRLVLHFRRKFRRGALGAARAPGPVEFPWSSQVLRCICRSRENL